MYCASSRRSKRPSLSRSAPSKMRSAGCCGPSNLSQKLKASWHRRTTGEPRHMPGHLSLWSISGTSCISYVLLDMDDMNDMASHCVSWQMWQVLWKYLRERVRRLSRQDWMLTAFIYIWLFEKFMARNFRLWLSGASSWGWSTCCRVRHLRWRFLTGFV